MAAEPNRYGTRDVVLTIMVSAVWGLNFIPIKWALLEIPAFAVASLRFLFAALPLVFFVPRPKVPAWRVIVYGLLIGVAQFGCLFLAIRLGLAAGLASLLMQVQMFFTIALAAIFTGDRITRQQVLGGIVSFGGVGLLAWNLLTEGASTTAAGLLLIAISAFSWASGNILAKATARKHPVDMFSLVVWSSLAAPIPLAIMSWTLEGGADVWTAITHASLRAWLSLLIMAYVATLFGYATWNRLLQRHAAAQVTPFTMLIPVFGLGGAALVLGERLNVIQILAAILVVLGLGVALLQPNKAEAPSVAGIDEAPIAPGK